MQETLFKTPLPCRTPRYDDRGPSDSDESIVSTNSDQGSASTQSSNGDISILAQFDDLIRSYEQIRCSKEETEASYLDFVEQVRHVFVDYFQAIDECKRLQAMLDRKTHECSDFEIKLQKARKLLDLERANTRNAMKQRDDLEDQIKCVRDVLFKEKNISNRISDEVYDKLSFLHSNQRLKDDYDYHQAQLSAIKEINSTGSILSDFSYSRSEDDLLVDVGKSQSVKPWVKHRPSEGGVAEPAVKKRRSSGNKAIEIGTGDTVRATTTLTVTKDGPITATSIIESVPKTPGAPESVITNGESYPSAPPANLVFESWARDSPRKPERTFAGRQHCFQQKTIVMPDTCGCCEKRIRFGKSAMKCKECKAICHIECKDNLPLPCIPLVNTPNQRNALGIIGDYTPTTPPMVPALLIHCINEIEMRGLTECGIYRVPGAERDVRALKERFLKGRGAPCLNQVEIHVICGVVKDFLRNLNEPIVTYALWKKFVEAADVKDPADRLPALFHTLSELPQPNRDTLAYMMLHLQKVSEAKECKMTVSNLAKVFGPTIVGYSSDDPSPSAILDEMVKHNNVMEHLINIPGDYWSTFINIEPTLKPSRLQQTPSTDSLLHATTTRGLLTPSRNIRKRKQRFFPSPKD